MRNAAHETGTCSARSVDRYQARFTSIDAITLTFRIFILFNSVVANYLDRHGGSDSLLGAVCGL